MITDFNLVFCEREDLSSATGTAVAGDVIDLERTGRRIGSNNEGMVVITVSEAFTSGGSATVQFQLASDSVATIDNSPTVHAASGPHAVADLTLGQRMILPLPSGFPAAERYLAILAVTGTATTTAGSINAEIVMDAGDWQAMTDAVN